MRTISGGPRNAFIHPKWFRFQFLSLELTSLMGPQDSSIFKPSINLWMLYDNWCASLAGVGRGGEIVPRSKETRMMQTLHCLLPPLPSVLIIIYCRDIDTNTRIPFLFLTTQISANNDSFVSRLWSISTYICDITNKSGLVYDNIITVYNMNE